MAQFFSKIKPIQKTPPQKASPRWGKRILENLKAAGIAAAITMGALSLHACSKAHMEPVVPRPPYNQYCDPQLGYVFVRADGMDSILFSPRDCGQNAVCAPAFPFAAWAVYYGDEARNP